MFEAFPGDERLVVPSVFRIEVIAALARRGESREVVDAVDALVQSPKFEKVPIEPALIELAVHVARTAKVRGYDALYAAVALERRTALLTLDDEVRKRMRRIFPDLQVP